MQAMSGMMMAGSPPGEEPVRACFPVADILAGQFACQGILAALFEKQKTGRGSHVDVALLESLLSAMSYLTASADIPASSPIKCCNAVMHGSP
jgi:crotonobetainyl-CoA:carnitine CoA-transferase CaiB-like acyl-CoA transferase